MIEVFFCYLNSSNHTVGWQCKFITDTKRHLPESTWEYYHYYGKHWFDYGYFKNKDTWAIDKESLLKDILNEVKIKKIYLCKFYKQENVEKIIAKLPDLIDLEKNTEWKVYEKEIDNGFTYEKVVVGVIPKNIYDLIKSNNSNWCRSIQIKAQKEEEIEDEIEERNIPDVLFNEIGGLGNTINIIREIIELPMKKPELFKKLNLQPHKGILMSGPPGCGKTLIAKAIANEVNAHFIAINGPEIISKWVGQSEQNLRNIFKEAKEYAPSIILFDEIDSIAQRRTGGDMDAHNDKLVNQLLTLLDGFETNNNVKVIATTNKPELIDEAVKRPGRFDYHIEISKPDLQGCKEILDIYIEDTPIDKDFNKEDFVKYLVGLSGADIAFIVREASYNCMRRNIDTKMAIISNTEIEYDKLLVNNDDFNKAYLTISDKNKDIENVIKIGF